MLFFTQILYKTFEINRCISITNNNKNNSIKNQFLNETIYKDKNK